MKKPGPPVPGADAYSVVERGPHHRVWERIEYELAPDGRHVPHRLRYVELATGMHYWDKGQWRESQELIESFPGGAVARCGQHKVIFAYNLATAGAIDMELPDGKRLRSHVLGLAYFDAASGKTVLIAEVKDCVGVIVEPNQVLYQDAFDGVRADVRYTYTRAGFEQDVILHERPLGPEAYGLAPSSTRRQVWTEFVSAPQPCKSRRSVQVGNAPQAVDERLDFRSMQIGSGKAFKLGAGRDGLLGRARGEPAMLEALQRGRGVAVGKQWLELDGRRFLVEEVPVPTVQEELEALPVASRPIANSNPRTIQQLGASLRRLPQAADRQESGPKVMQLASASAVESPAYALVLDYVTLNSSLSNYTFRGDTTYFVNGWVTLYGTTVFEGGTVVKYSTNTSATLYVPYGSGQVVCQTAPYRPAVFTSMHDNSVGERIAGSTGNPVRHPISNSWLSLDVYEAVLRNIRLSYAGIGIGLFPARLTLQNCQFVVCGYGIAQEGGENLSLRNCLFIRCVAPVACSGQILSGEHLSVERCGFFAEAAWAHIRLTNCILANVTNLYSVPPQSISGSHNGFFNSPQFGVQQFVSPVYPFQTVGGGAHYLVDGAGFRNVGSTDISPGLLAELRKKTTYPPVVLSNITISGATTWLVQAQRDTDVPDLGYHYDPLDYLVYNVRLSGNFALSLEEGVAVASFGRVGLSTFDAGKLISRGSPTRWNKLCFYQAVQELPVRLNNTASSSMWLMEWYGYSPPAVIQARFTDFSGMAMPSALLSGLSQQVELRDCRIGPGAFNVDSAPTRVAFTNNLLERVSLYVGTFDWVCPIYFYNNLVRHSSVYFDNGYAAPVARWIHDNLFDTSTIGGAYTNFPTFRHSHNAYYMTTRLAGSLGGDKILTAVDYQPGPLGDYYYPSTGGNLSQLIGAGSRTAAAAGLYHYTVKPNNLKEGEDNNPPGTVDIGYHYVACNAQGQPIDTDGDGTPDYLEDRNGNGLVDSDETDWNDATDLGLKVTITRPRSGSLVP